MPWKNNNYSLKMSLPNHKFDNDTNRNKTKTSIQVYIILNQL